MFRFRILGVVAALAVAAAASFAQDDQHRAHHSAGAFSATMSASATGKLSGMLDMAMQPLHEKMAGAKTPVEHDALMAEHMRLMPEGMSMMDRTPMSRAAPGQ